jgi:hypothetical protein
MYVRLHENCEVIMYIIHIHIPNLESLSTEHVRSEVSFWLSAMFRDQFSEPSEVQNSSESQQSSLSLCFRDNWGEIDVSKSRWHF